MRSSTLSLKVVCAVNSPGSDYQTSAERQKRLNDKYRPAMPAVKKTPPPGFNLPRKLWSTLNRIRTNHGNRAAFHYRWNRIPTPECDCGATHQTIQHIINKCRTRKYNSSATAFALASPEAIDYIKSLETI